MTVVPSYVKLSPDLFRGDGLVITAQSSPEIFHGWVFNFEEVIAADSYSRAYLHCTLKCDVVLSGTKYTVGDYFYRIIIRLPLNEVRFYHSKDSSAALVTSLLEIFELKSIV